MSLMTELFLCNNNLEGTLDALSSDNNWEGTIRLVSYVCLWCSE